MDARAELDELERHIRELESGGVRFTHSPEDFEMFGRADHTEPYLVRLRARRDELRRQLGLEA